MTPSFDRFAVADWSGARGRRHPGIALAECGVDSAAPRLVRPPERHWSRAAVGDWVIDQAAAGRRTLIGFDFSFAPPWRAAGYLPGTHAPADAHSFWAWIDRQAHDEPDGGAAVWMEGPARRHFYFGKADGAKADYMVWRACERRLRESGGHKPSTVFDAIGAAQVAKASFAGMRLLHRLSRAGVPVWPFDPVPNEGPLIVEIYSSIAASEAGRPNGRAKLRSAETLNEGLRTLGSAPVADEPDEHQADAILTAAWLRRTANDHDLWTAPDGHPLAGREGWTFGVR